MDVYEALLQIPCEDAEIIKKAIEVEKDSEFSASVKAENGRLVIEIRSSRLSMLQAGINSYLRAIKSLAKNRN